MRGIVKLINTKKEWIAIYTEHDFYCVTEIVDSHLPELGDVISGNLGDLGGERFYNESSQESFDVFVQDLNDNRQQVINQLGNL
ncbi:hypothetical protein ACQKMD_11295 [Viridibacillus sp. NPDC096237]|uniref:hypothetical protein n=1 Tax=Viridibacillus sp. NPDC096237 TaxID=3390721 RepID=UPI003D040162